MTSPTPHTFHIPVMGLGFTIDTPIKVARFGISSVISIAEDVLVEQMRKFHSEQSDLPYEAITKHHEDARAERITAYLNLVQHLVNKQIEVLRNEPFAEGNEIITYFDLLPNESPLKADFMRMMALPVGDERSALETYLRSQIVAGQIDVNIMAKADRLKYTDEGEGLVNEFSQALASFRGFAQSNLSSAVVLSAGYNPRLYAYIEQFKDFFPDEAGHIKKRIILKVSDYRSALTQGKLLAKKGVWISEYRIESGLNCGGHAFATDGLLLGPILEEFKKNKESLIEELYQLCNQALTAKGVSIFPSKPELKITVQGGVGTASEHLFLLEYYQTDSIGWGSPFLLVSEATNVDKATLHQLATASKDDYYLSNASPFGIPFNNFKKSSSNLQRNARIEKGRPGSPCYKKELASNTEFTKEPICTASREYQFLKIKQLQSQNLSEDAYQKAYNQVVEKECLCEGLASSALLTSDIQIPHNLTAVAICPGPNLAYFSGEFTLRQMIDHIYGRIQILNKVPRPHVFVNELVLYVDYLKAELNKNIDSVTANKARQLKEFQSNLMKGISYYKELLSELKHETSLKVEEMKFELLKLEAEIKLLELSLIPA